MKKKNRIVVFVLTLALFAAMLSGCSGQAASGNQADKISVNKESAGYGFLSEQFEDLESLTSVQVGGERLQTRILGDYMSFIVPRSTQQQELLDLLLAVDFSKAEKVEQGGSNVTLRFTAGESITDIRLGKMEDANYIAFIDIEYPLDLETFALSETQRIYRLPEGSLPLDEILELYSQIIQDTEDEEYKGLVYSTGSDSEKAALQKIKSFYARDVFENTLKSGASEKAVSEDICEKVFEFQGIKYLVDSDDGFFIRSDGSAKAYGQVDPQIFRTMKMMCGF